MSKEVNAGGRFYIFLVSDNNVPRLCVAAVPRLLFKKIQYLKLLSRTSKLDMQNTICYGVFRRK